MEDLLEKVLGEEDLYNGVRVWSEFEACKRKPDEKVEEYIDKFERCYERVAASSKTANIPEEIRTFMVLERAGVTETQIMFIKNESRRKNKNVWQNV